MGALKKVLIGLGAVVVGLVVVGFLLPDTVHVERSIEIDAPPSTTFALVNGFKSFNKWSPWAARDPNTQYAFSGPESGVGAMMAWTSTNKEVGNGSQEVLESVPYSLVRVKLDFGEQGVSNAYYKVEPAGQGSHLTWGFDTEFKGDLVGRYFGLMLDRFIGPDYEKGLASLKTLAETLPKTDFSDLKVEVVQVSPMPLAVISRTTAGTAEGIGAGLGSGYQAIMAYMADQGLEAAGAPISISKSWEAPGESYSFDAAIPVRARSGAGEPGAMTMPEDGAAQETAAMAEVDISQVSRRDGYGGRALKAVHTGAYKNMTSTYDKIKAYMAVNFIEPSEPPYEEYLSDPGNTPEDQLITNIYVPIP